MKLTLIAALIGLTAATVCAQLPVGEVWDSPLWVPFPAKTLDSRSDYTVNPANLALSKYGGWLNGPRQTATGFFRVAKINGRWWCVDPEGYLYIHKALCSVNMDFNTADELYTMMRDYGFNGFGNWTWNGPTGGGPPGRSIIEESTVKDQIPMGYTARFGMIQSYRGARLPAGTPRIELPVWDPGFAQMAPVYAQNNITATLKNDPHLFGYFTDNELPFNNVLPVHLEITNQSDPNYLAAVDFLTSRGKTPANYDASDSTAYTALCGERYYSLVSAAIRAVDPNHMYLGSRCHSGEKGNEQFMRNAGKYVDIMGVNHYHHWGDRRLNTNNMAEWLGRPLLFSEFYVKSLEDGDSTASGAGFNGRNLSSGALFYQNYVTTHLESGNLVGFHWFKYGAIVGEAGALGESGSFNNVLFDSMKKMHTQMYDFIDYLDSPRSAPDTKICPEADAYFAGGVNKGTAPDLQAQSSSAPLSQWQIYMRFDVSSLGNQVDSANIVLRNIKSGGKFRVEFVEDDSWGETTINSGNAPIGSTLLLESNDGRSDVEIDVSSVIRQQIQGDGKLSVRIIAIGDSMGYGSRENPNPVARPVLIVDHVDRSYWVGGDGTWDTIANWSTASGTATPSPLAKPGYGDNVVFNITNGNSNQIVDFTNGNQAANSLRFNSTGTTTLTKEDRDSSSTSRMLTLGIGGLTVSPNAGNVNIGAANQLIQVGFAAGTFFKNDSANSLTLSRQVMSNANSGALTLTINGAGSGVTDFQREIQQGAGSTLSLNINTTGGHTTVFRHSGSTFSRGLTLTQGNLALRGSGATIGAGTVTIKGGAIGAVDGARSFTANLSIIDDFQLGGVTFGSSIATDATFSGTVDLADRTRTITLGGNTHTFSGQISSGGLNLVSNGQASQFILGAGNPFSGPTTVGINVTLTLNNNGALQNSLLNTDGGGNVQLGSAVNTPTLGGLNGTTNLASFITTNYNLATGLTLNLQSGTSSYSGNITNGAVGMSLTKTGSGTQILSGSNGYTGATHVNVGTLSVTGSLTSAVTVANGATLSGTGTTTGTLTLNGGSAIVASPSGNSFKAETVTANSSVKILVLDGSGAIGSRTVGVARYNTGSGPNTANFSTAGFRNGVVSNVGTSGGETQLTYTSEARTWNPAAGTWSTSAIAWQEGDFKFTQGDVVTFDDTGTGGGVARTVTLNSLVSPGGVTFNNSITTPYTVKGTGRIDGSSGLTKTGNGTVALSTSNTYTGPTTVSAGTLTLGHLTDTIDGPITVNGGTLDVANEDTVGAVTLTAGTITGDGTLTGSSYAVQSGTVSTSLAGSGSLTKTTSGTVVLSGSSSYSGGTVLNEGRIGIRTSSSALGSGTVTINGGVIGSVVTTRSVSNNFLINNNFQFGGVGAPGLGNAGTNFNGNIDLGGATRTITLADGTTIDGDISNGGLTINATSSNRTLTIGYNSVSTYTGPTNIKVGGLTIHGNSSAATGQISVGAGATLGGNGTSGGAVVMTPTAKLSARITDWNGAAGIGYEDLAVASLNAGGGALSLVVNATGLTNFTETNKSFTILNTSGGITGFVAAQVTITTTGFTGTGRWALLQTGSSLVLNYTGADLFPSWIDPFNVADETRGGDPDNDGIRNLMEFVFNGNPGISDTAILPDLGLSSTEFTFTYVRRIDSLGVPQVVQYGSNLIGWTDVAIPNAAGITTVGASTVIVGEPASGMQTVTVRMPPSEPEIGKLFGRLKVGP